MAHAATFSTLGARVGGLAAPAAASQKDALRGAALCTPGIGMRSVVVKSASTSSTITASAQKGDDAKPAFGAALRNAAFGLAAAASVAFPTLPADAVLPSGEPVNNPDALLRYALPIQNKPIRKIQKSLEDINQGLRVPSMRVKVDAVNKGASKSLDVVKKDSAKIIADVAPAKKAEATKILAELNQGLIELKSMADKEDIQEVPYKQQALLKMVGEIEADMVEKFPFEVPAEYASMPLLKGRATIEAKVIKKREIRTETEVVTMVVDGLNAPVTAGNFVDLVARGFYNGMEIQRADGFVVQTGDPSYGKRGQPAGYVDPATGKVRTIPLEIKVDKDKEPIYNFPLEEIGRFNEQPTLSFNAYGTMAMAREEFDPDSASSQIFWLLKENEITPSASNILDGRYAVFGYATENNDMFGKLKVGDKIEYMKVTQGMEYLENYKKTAPAPADVADAE